MTMRTLSKNQILAMTHTTFYVWTPNIEAMEVSKKSLRKSLKPRNYVCDFTEVGTISYGKKVGQPWMACMILIW